MTLPVKAFVAFLTASSALAATAAAQNVLPASAIPSKEEVYAAHAKRHCHQLEGVRYVYPAGAPVMLWNERNEDRTGFPTQGIELQSNTKPIRSLEHQDYPPNAKFYIRPVAGPSCKHGDGYGGFNCDIVYWLTYAAEKRSILIRRQIIEPAKTPGYVDYRTIWAHPEYDAKFGPIRRVSAEGEMNPVTGNNLWTYLTWQLSTDPGIQSPYVLRGIRADESGTSYVEERFIYEECGLVGIFTPKEMQTMTKAESHRTCRESLVDFTQSRDFPDCVGRRFSGPFRDAYVKAQMDSIPGMLPVIGTVKKYYECQNSADPWCGVELSAAAVSDFSLVLTPIFRLGAAFTRAQIAAKAVIFVGVVGDIYQAGAALGRGEIIASMVSLGFAGANIVELGQAPLSRSATANKRTLTYVDSYKVPADTQCVSAEKRTVQKRPFNFDPDVPCDLGTPPKDYTSRYVDTDINKMHQAAEEFRLRRGLDDYISRANLEKGLANLSSIEQSILDDVGITPNQAMERLEDFYDSWVKTRFSQASGDLPKGHTLRADEDMVVRLSDLEAIAKFCKTDASPLCLEYYIENLKMKLSRQFNSFNYSICSNSRTGCVQVPKSLKLLEQFTEDGVQKTVVRHITECDLHQNAAIRQFARSYNLVLREEFQHAFLQIGSDGNFVTYVLTRSEIDRWAAKVAGSPELAKRLDDYYVEIGAAPWNFADSDAETLSRSILRDTYNWEWDIYVTPILAARNKEGLRTAAAFTSNYPVRLKYLAGNEDELAAQLGVSVAELHEFAVRNGKRHMDPGLELDELRAAFDAVGHQ